MDYEQAMAAFTQFFYVILDTFLPTISQSERLMNNFAYFRLCCNSSAIQTSPI